MRWLRRLIARIKYRDFDRDLRDELAAHHAMAQSDLEADGVSTAEARRRAHRELGNATLARESARAVWIPTMIENIWRDVRYAVRSLATHPGFTLTSVLTLVMAILATAATLATYIPAWRAARGDPALTLRSE